MFSQKMHLTTPCMKGVVKHLQGLYPGLRVRSQCNCNILVRHGAQSGLESNRNKGNLYTRPAQILSDR